MTTPVQQASALAQSAAGPTPTPADADFQKFLTLINAQIKATQKTLAAQNASLAALKKVKGGSAAAKAKIAQRISAQEQIIKATSAKLATQQQSVTDKTNKYYQDTGQYDKLLQGTDRDAFMAITSLFKSYGLDTLAPKIFDYVKNGYSADTVSILLQDTPEYKQRFAGNEIRKQKGLPVLNPGEYLATESSYKQIMQSAGLPTGFYDQNSDFNDWIGKNISPSEIQTRVDLATQATVLSNPNYRKALNAMGIPDSQLTAYFLDSTRALPHLQKSAATAAIGAEAYNQGLTFDKSYSEQLATEGISADQARQGYSQIAQELDTFKALGSMYGEDWTQRTSEQSVLEGNGAANTKRNKLLSQERGNFSGSAGGGRGGLSQQGGAR